jgi:hypothetical protein
MRAHPARDPAGRRVGTTAVGGVQHAPTHLLTQHGTTTRRRGVGEGSLLGCQLFFNTDGVGGGEGCRPTCRCGRRGRVQAHLSARADGSARLLETPLLMPEVEQITIIKYWFGTPPFFSNHYSGAPRRYNSCRKIEV